MRRWSRGILLFVCLGACVLCGNSWAGTGWPGFRGPNFDGTVPEAKLFEGESASLTVGWKRALGSGYSAIAVDDVYAACERIRELGGNVVRDAGPMKGGTTVLAFVEDPDGYKVELLADTA